jgi:Helicase C-terminal domain
MAFDFDELASTSALTDIRDPAELFDALPQKAEGYGYLRVVQKTVLDAWSPRRDERDIVIKTNTGGGKTIVGLLLLQCGLHDGKGPALYLAPDPHLALRVIGEATNLGLSVVGDPDDARFLSCEAICVTTMRTLVNGRTRFGLRGPGGREPVTIGSIVVDDAHAALALTEESTQLRIPASHATHAELLELFEDELRAQSANAYLDIVDGDRSAVLRVPFSAWRAKQDRVLALLRPHRTEANFEWAWPLVADLLAICQCVVSADGFEITPPCPPIEKFPSFAEAERRIYLTATLADDSVLVTYFDADPETVGKPIVPESAADLGDRLILAPEQINPAISHADVRSLAKQVAQTRNVVVLVPSKRQARVWDNEASLTVSKADEITTAVERLVTGHVGVVVIINRYDGIDLPGEACRLLIIDSLPFAYTGTERREAVALRDSDAMVTRQLQRLEQGMGRGVRSRDDRCAVLLLGARLTRLVARGDVADRLSAATREQLKLSRQVASKIEGSSIDDLLPVVQQVVEGDEGFRRASREALRGAKYGPPYLSPTAAPLRAAYNSAAAGRSPEAVAQSREAVEAARASGDTRLAGWIGETHATYLDAVDPVTAQAALKVSGEENANILRPLDGLPYRRIEAPAQQAGKASSFLSETYSSGTDLVVEMDAILADIDWDKERTDEAEAALYELGLHLGCASQQPEKTFGVGPDVLWAMTERRYIVIEAKTGATAPMIWKKDINQLAGSVNWCSTEYGDDAKIVPLLVHPSDTVEGTGTAPAGTRIITTAKLTRLKNAVRQYARALAQDEQFQDPAAVEAQLDRLKLNESEIIETFTVPSRRERN